MRSETLCAIGMSWVTTTLVTFSSRWSFMIMSPIRVTRSLALGSSELTVGANASYVGEQFFDEFNRAPFVGDSYTLYDGNVTYRPTSEAWSVSLWGRNLGNEKEFADLSYSALGRVTSKKFINPRTYGVSFNYNF